jgi:osmotically-inducible protein OsmY
MSLQFPVCQHTPRRLADVVEEATNRLGATAHLFAAQVRCTLRGEVLVLQGRVGSYFQKQVAQEAVKHLDGVVQILNQIEVGS